MSDPQRIVIIGTGLAGATAAGALRERGYSGQLTLLGEEARRPYELPALSKGILLGETNDPDWVHDEAFYQERDIDLRLSTVVSGVRLADREVVEADGTAHPFDRLLLATGSAPRRLEVPGAELAGLRTLRSLDDALGLREELSEGRRVVIVGGGWIGCEVAAAARAHGAEVTVVDPLPLPLHRVLGDVVAGVYRDVHAAHGVNWRLGVGVTAFLGEGAVSGVALADGSELPADVVLVAVGAAPRVELAAAMGLELAYPGGVAVDEELRTSAPDVYAIGDIAAQVHPRYRNRVRVEHWANAKDQGAHVAGNLLGGHEPYRASPYFFSDQYDLGMEFRGLADPAVDTLVVRGDLAAREFIAFWLRDGVVRAAMNVNMWDDGDALGKLVDGDTTVDSAGLVAGDLASMMG
ncbi:NAD(P)/FAD-dependent oxidoreductase [Actinophytocola xanthii]|uniref:FAD-dependent oxidoreductase n=1 Tax=Actinophytocola xanthii TaxID=1912961 RepID=A0A1Q8CR41_9PSEU|nr:FAD-dependent oxidoreductase [Actinophytocola xanthii]OLF16814.1 FAD-dependent oxidoreductase [Actinophytocola xanthii]